MMKLFLYEWKRYRLSILIMVLCVIGCNLIGLLNDLTSYSMDFSLDVLFLLISAGIHIPGTIYAMMSYTNDTGRKGLIFLTPSKPWKVVLSKLLFGMVVTICLSLLVALLSLGSSAILTHFGEDAGYLYGSLHSLISGGKSNPYLDLLLELLRSLQSMLTTSVMLITSLALAKFSAKSGAVQGILTVVYYLLLQLVENFLVWMLLYLLPPSKFSSLLDTLEPIHLSVSLLFIFGGYFLTSFLTAKKINLA